jgi:hypothetical protein
VVALPSRKTVAALGVVFYLCAAGWFFILAPWSRFWGVVVVPRVPLALIPLVDSPVLRGALSGFGALHFVAAFVWLAEATRRP